MLVLLVTTSCRDSVDLDDYDTSCKLASDCVPVLAGPRCSCACDYAAINSKSLAQYQEDFQDLDCPGCGIMASCGRCQAVYPVCQAGRCEVRMGHGDGGSADGAAGGSQ